MVREGYSQITVSDQTKARFDEQMPDSDTQDIFVNALLDSWEGEPDGYGEWMARMHGHAIDPPDDAVVPDDAADAPRRIPEEQYADLVDDVSAVVERQLEQAMRENTGFR